MKNLKIGAKITLGFVLVLALLLVISLTSVFSTVQTASNVDEVDLYSGLQSSANDLMHILNETRITAGVLYETRSADAYADITKQLLYCDVRLQKLYEYIDAYPALASFRPQVENFEALYRQWTGIVSQMDTDFSQVDEARKTNLLCHEMLSNTILDIDDAMAETLRQTKNISYSGLWIVVGVAGLSLAAALVVAFLLVRSITVPMGHMRDVLNQIGQTGDLQVPEETQNTLRGIARGKDETAQCTGALLVLVDRLHTVDETLTQVAGGDLRTEVQLQSGRDTMGLAMQKMIGNLNQKFGAIMHSTGRVYEKAEELAEGSRLLASGSQSQAESVANLAASVQDLGQKTEKSSWLASQATELVTQIEANAQESTEQMNRMIGAAGEIRNASQAISEVIKTIDDLAFQTNILALNASVEAARAGQQGKGFAVVAEEVRNLATKSAGAARDTGALIEDTVQKAALGAEIAETTSQSLAGIVEGVAQSTSIIHDIMQLSSEQAAGIQQIGADVEKVEQIVEQNNAISTQSAGAAGDISGQSNLLRELVAQFQLQQPAQIQPRRELS